MKDEFDEVTGLSRKVIIEHTGDACRVSIKDESARRPRCQADPMLWPDTYWLGRISSSKRGHGVPR